MREELSPPPAWQVPLRGRSLTLTAVLLALVLGVLGGVRWQESRQSRQRADAVDVRVEILDGEPVGSAAPGLRVRLRIDNRAQRPASLERLQLSATGAAGYLGPTNLPADATTSAAVTLPVPCAATLPAELTATLTVRAASGRQQTLDQRIDGSPLAGVAPCEDTPDTPTATVTGSRPTAAGVDVTVRVELPATAAGPATDLSLVDAPLTDGTPGTFSVQPRTPTDQVIHLDVDSYCGAEGTEFPASLVLMGGPVRYQQVPLPLAAVSALVDEIERRCPARTAPGAAGTSR